MSMEVLSTDVGVAGAMMCEVSCAGMHGCVKADNDNMGANVGMHESHGVGDRRRRRLLGHGNVWRWRNPDVSSMRCNKLPWDFLGSCQDIPNNTSAVAYWRFPQVLSITSTTDEL